MNISTWSTNSIKSLTRRWKSLRRRCFVDYQSWCKLWTSSLMMSISTHARSSWLCWYHQWITTKTTYQDWTPLSHQTSINHILKSFLWLLTPRIYWIKDTIKHRYRYCRKSIWMLMKNRRHWRALLMSRRWSDVSKALAILKKHLRSRHKLNSTRRSMKLNYKT